MYMLIDTDKDCNRPVLSSERTPHDKLKKQLSWPQPKSDHESRRGPTPELTDWLTDWPQLQSNSDNPEDEGNTVLLNVCVQPPHYTAQQPRKPRIISKTRSSYVDLRITEVELTRHHKACPQLMKDDALQVLHG
jgi:hypothetical protein